jgi:hypothetical protein
MRPDDQGRCEHICTFCEARHWAVESFETCCKNGDVNLPWLSSPPRFIWKLFTDQDTVSRKFREYIRKYNNALAFTSMSCKQDKRLDGTTGVQCFQIQGELFHYQGPLEPASSNAIPAFAQLIFYDPEQATDYRARQHRTLDHCLLWQLEEMLRECNPFIQLYKTARERLREQANGPLRIILNPQMRLIMEKGADRRRENLPTANEVAVLIPNEIETTGPRDLVLAVRQPGNNNQMLSTVHVLHAAYAPLHYVLFFPKGDVGWHWGLTLQDRGNRRKKNRLEQQMFYRFRLHRRHRERSLLFYGCRLF